MVIHGAFGAAVQAQDGLAFTVKEPEPPDAGIVCPVGASENVQPLV
jgi:hypothetical protein